MNQRIIKHYLEEKAKFILASVKTAIINGCKHYDTNNQLLTTEKEILQALRHEIPIRVDASERKEITTMEAELAKL